MEDPEEVIENKEFDGALPGKLDVRLGQLEFAGEGQQAFLAAQLDKLVSAHKGGGLGAGGVGTHAAAAVGESAAAAKFTASLASHIRAMNADGNQNRRFLATADWLRNRGMDPVTTAAVSKALTDNHQSRLANPAECLNRNVAKGFCEKVSNGFYITPEGLKELGYP